MKVFVGNLSKQINDAQLGDLATPYGKLISASVATERVSGESKGFGFLEFGSDAEGQAAIKGLDGCEVNGPAVNVSESKARRDAGFISR